MEQPNYDPMLSTVRKEFEDAYMIMGLKRAAKIIITVGRVQVTDVMTEEGDRAEASITITIVAR